MGFQGTKSMLWLEGQQIQPGIKVLDGPFDWQSAPGSTIPQQPPDALQASLCDIQENMPQHPEPDFEIPDLTKFIVQQLLSCQRRREPLFPRMSSSPTFALPLPRTKKPFVRQPAVPQSN